MGGKLVEGFYVTVLIGLKAVDVGDFLQPRPLLLAAGLHHAIDQHAFAERELVDHAAGHERIGHLADVVAGGITKETVAVGVHFQHASARFHGPGLAPVSLVTLTVSAGLVLAGARASLCPGNVTWAEFRQRYTDENLSALAERTLDTASTAMNHVERVINPAKLSALSAAVLSRFQTSLRKQGMADTSIAVYLRHLRAGLSWAVSMGMLAKVPELHVPKRARGKTSRGRPLRLEEAEKMFLVVPKVRPDDAASWQRFLTGLWLSGLRLEEALALSWDDDKPFAVDLSAAGPGSVSRGKPRRAGKINSCL